MLRSVLSDFVSSTWPAQEEIASTSMISGRYLKVIKRLSGTCDHHRERLFNIGSKYNITGLDYNNEIPPVLHGCLLIILCPNHLEHV